MCEVGSDDSWKDLVVSFGNRVLTVNVGCELQGLHHNHLRLSAQWQIKRMQHPRPYHWASCSPCQQWPLDVCRACLRTHAWWPDYKSHHKDVNHLQALSGGSTAPYNLMKQKAWGDWKPCIQALVSPRRLRELVWTRQGRSVRLCPLLHLPVLQNREH